MAGQMVWEKQLRGFWVLFCNQQIFVIYQLRFDQRFSFFHIRIIYCFIYFIGKAKFCVFRRLQPPFLFCRTHLTLKFRTFLQLIASVFPPEAGVVMLLFFKQKSWHKFKMGYTNLSCAELKKKMNVRFGFPTFFIAMFFYRQVVEQGGHCFSSDPFRPVQPSNFQPYSPVEFLGWKLMVFLPLTYGRMDIYCMFVLFFSVCMYMLVFKTS